MAGFALYKAEQGTVFGHNKRVGFAPKRGGCRGQNVSENVPGGRFYGGPLGREPRRFTKLDREPFAGGPKVFLNEALPTEQDLSPGG